MKLGMGVRGAAPRANGYQCVHCGRPTMAYSDAVRAEVGWLAAVKYGEASHVAGRPIVAHLESVSQPSHQATDAFLAAYAQLGGAL